MERTDSSKPDFTNAPSAPMFSTADMLSNPCERIDVVNEQLRLIQRTSGLTFGTDAYLLAAMLKKRGRAVGVELGGGTGIVSLLAVTKEKFSKVHIWEIQPEYAELCSRNAVLNHLEDQITVHTGDIRLANPSDVGMEADAVYSNPPYMLPGSGKANSTQEMNIARREENGSIADFCAAAARMLKYGGTFTVVYRPDRFIDLIAALRTNKLEPKYAVFVYPSIHDAPCLVLLEAKKGASAALSIAPPLIIYADKTTGLYTPEMQQVYATCSLRFLFP